MAPSTRIRLLDAARALFAERGYHGTSVGDVEAAAGLTPRSGALYKHFASKEALLHAVFAREDETMERLSAEVTQLDLGDLGAELRLLGHIGLAEMRRERDLVRIVMKEGDAFPAVAEAFRDVVIGRSQPLAANWVRARLPRYGSRVEDPDGVAAVLVSALVGRFLEETLFGAHPRGVEDERFLAAWSQTAMAVVARNETSEVR
jgi:AcrR family transcriptional regulator